MKLRVEGVVLANATEVHQVGKAVITKFVAPVAVELVIVVLHKRLSNRQEECSWHCLQYLNV